MFLCMHIKVDISMEINDVQLRLAKLYDTLETGKLGLDDLAPRIRDLRARQDELNKSKVQVEAELILHGAPRVDLEAVKAYAEDLKLLLCEAEITERKAFLRSFVKRITVDGNQVRIEYHLPLP
jgi:site-specific DNA recombinase